MPAYVVVLEFPGVQEAKGWLDSPEYRDARAIRRASTVSNAIVTQGLP